jgi:hypothetical protein
VATPLNPIQAALQRISKNLSEAGRKWALVGGLAVSARAEPRTTRDVDLVLRVSDDEDAEELVRWLQGRGYQVFAALEHKEAKRLATVRFESIHEDEIGIAIDLLFASSGVEAEIIQAAEILEVFPGLFVPVASLGHLLALKALARDDRHRPQDLDDIRSLLRESEPKDVEDAKEAMRLIQNRGYHRGKDLPHEFDRLLREEVEL